MPELPDVEATRRYLLDQGLAGRTFTGATILWPKAIRSGPVEEFVLGLTGRRIDDVARRAKYLLVRLQPDDRAEQTLVIHLRMTGSLIVEPGASEPPRYAHNILHLDDGRDLRFVDPRKLGTLALVADEASALPALGPEPLEPAFTPQALGKALGRRVPVKALLCDQAVVAGIGNIYADEALFLACVHPAKPGNELTPAEVERLHGAIVSSLTEATVQIARIMPAKGPPTESDEGRSVLCVPRMAGAPCTRCGKPVQRVVIRSRSAYFCPRCQRG
ncbi:MAG: bifunctional DNA-formamidopyrimidine glycosylase/DNA-(apurinic or apyrimidinic site) lyase [Chloroflexi bacterium]|nr:bifunctional DNA-formamidopyrimidine glycosylase/DNA-(apurinic or apyrimidinic site) lyase [Chloroflexota bacterium]